MNLYNFNNIRNLILSLFVILLSCERESMRIPSSLVECAKTTWNSVAITCSESNPPLISWSKTCDFEYYTMDINNGQTNANLLHSAIDKGATSYTVDAKVVELLTAGTTTQSVEYKVVLTVSVDNMEYPIEKKCTLNKGSTGQGAGGGAGGGTGGVPPVIDDTYTTKEVSIRVDNKYFVSAEWGGGQDVNANRDIAKEWEKFTLLQYKDGRSAFKTEKNYYLTVTDNNEIKASAKTISEKEYFTLTYINNSSTDVNIKAYNGKYVCSDRDKGWKLYANRDVAKEWEVFKIENYKYGNGEGVDPSIASVIAPVLGVAMGSPKQPIIKLKEEVQNSATVGGAGGSQFDWNCPTDNIAVGAIFYEAKNNTKWSVFGIQLVCRPIGKKIDENTVTIENKEASSDKTFGYNGDGVRSNKSICPDFKQGNNVAGQGYLRGFYGTYNSVTEENDSVLPDANATVITSIGTLCGYITSNGLLETWQGNDKKNNKGECTGKDLLCTNPNLTWTQKFNIEINNALVTGIHGSAANRLDALGVYYRGKE